MKNAWPIAMTLALSLHIGVAVLTARFGPRDKPVQPRLSIRLKTTEPPKKMAVAPSKPQALVPPVPATVSKPRAQPVLRKRKLRRPSRAHLVPVATPKTPEAAQVSDPGATSVKAQPIPTPSPQALAKAEAPKPPPPDLGPVRRRLLSALASHKRYPRRARRLKQQGTVLLKVVLTAAGRLAQPARVLKSSGYKMLDREALRMVDAAAPFEALPDGLDSAEFEIPLRFALK